MCTADLFVLILNGFDFVINSRTEVVGLSLQPGLILSLEKLQFHSDLLPQSVHLLSGKTKHNQLKKKKKKNHASVTSEKSYIFRSSFISSPSFHKFGFKVKI